jgi:hypothetical protein
MTSATATLSWAWTSARWTHRPKVEAAGPRAQGATRARAGVLETAAVPEQVGLLVMEEREVEEPPAAEVPAEILEALDCQAPLAMRAPQVRLARLDPQVSQGRRLGREHQEHQEPRDLLARPAPPGQEVRPVALAAPAQEAAARVITRASTRTMARVTMEAQTLPGHSALWALTAQTVLARREAQGEQSVAVRPAQPSFRRRAVLAACVDTKEHPPVVIPTIPTSSRASAR